MGNTDLHQILRSLCLDTVWRYAVFWKLKHRSRMVLTWEDAYYDKCEQKDPSGNNCFGEVLETFHMRHYSHDPLGLALAKMSYHAYSLGEGIVGRVAASGTHEWISAYKLIHPSCSPFEFSDGWLNQFAAGIKTIAVVAVVPHGVLQLGSLRHVYEDKKIVSQIRDAFFALQDSSVGHITAPVRCNMKTPVAQKSGVNVMSNHDGVKLSKEDIVESTKLMTTRSHVPDKENQDKVGRHRISNGLHEGETSGWRNMTLKSEENVYESSLMSSVGFFDFALQDEELGVDRGCFASNLHGSALSGRTTSEGMELCETEILKIPESSDLFEKDFNKLEYQNGSNHLDSTNSLKFTAGCELYEVLGPAFLKKSMPGDWQTANTEGGANVEMQEVMSSSQLTFESGSENLLEAVVANLCHNDNKMESEVSHCRLVPSLLTDENTPEPSSQTMQSISSAGYSISLPSLLEKNTRHHVDSAEFCGGMSSKGFSSNCVSTCSEQFERSSEPVKGNKKRTRPGENSRPRPRDRQLIQDRIKELRELVPSSGKCSIDSLLERTIKHMLFLQSVTMHVDKLSKCAESKMHQSRTATQGSSSYEQGSSWAVEVGSHLKVCSVVVENLNKNGQMLVEMLCEDCSHFLEITEAIRSLGLTILKGVTEAHGEKTWICFVVEGQNNRIMHRMDILWPLVQVLQSKSTG